METQYYRAKTWQIVVFGLAQAAANMFMLLMNFSQYAAIGLYGIAVVTVSVLLTFTRIFDAITDPICGFITDHVNTRFGRVRPMLLLGYLIMAAATLIMFFVGSGSGIGGLLLFGGLYCIYIIGYTIINIAIKTALPILTNDPKQRPLAGRCTAFATVTLSTVFMIYFSKVLAAKHGGINVGAIQELNITVLVMSGICVALVIFALKDRDRQEIISGMTADAKPSVKDSLRAVKGNRPLQMLIVAAATDKLAQQTAGNSSINIMLFGIIIGNYAFQGTMSLYAYVPSLIMIYLITRFARKMGSRNALLGFSWAGVIVSALMVLFLTAVDPTKIGSAAIPTILFLILNLAKSGIVNANSSLTNVMIADCADYEMYRTGKFMPAVTSTVFSFIDKLFSSLSTTIVGLVLATIGYTETLPQIGDANSTPLFIVTMILAFGIPALGWICSIIALKFYDLTPEKMAEVQKHNAMLREKGSKNA